LTSIGKYWQVLTGIDTSVEWFAQLSPSQVFYANQHMCKKSKSVKSGRAKKTVIHNNT